MLESKPFFKGSINLLLNESHAIISRVLKVHEIRLDASLIIIKLKEMSLKLELMNKHISVMTPKTTQNSRNNNIEKRNNKCKSPGEM